MAYLFWASAAVWVGIFLYLYGLLRRSRTLEHEVEALRERSQRGTTGGTAPPPAHSGDRRERRGGGRSRAERA